MWEELGISGGTAIIILIALYFVIKWAVRNGVTEAYERITGKEVMDAFDELGEKEVVKRQKEESL
ncbi:hypothetical protein D5278_15525 [bacterium 1XD21-13]|nr:hypothetical protein [bacterium 1XD21-13]